MSEEILQRLWNLKKILLLGRKEGARVLLVGDLAKPRPRGENVQETNLGDVWGNHLIHFS